MSRFLHTMVEVVDPAKGRVFYEALGLQSTGELPIVREGQHEATNYFFSFPGDEAELELTWNTDGRTYDNSSGYGHIAIGVDDLDATLAALAGHGIEPEKPPYRIREGGSRLCFVRDSDGCLSS